MSDNTVLNAGTGGDSVRTIDKSGKKTQVVTLDLGGSGAESLISGSFPVTGTFWQATQPVSGTVGVSGSVAVTGSFYQATQPVSGTFWQTTQPVSGTFWQTTQPVSIASMPSTPVTGTFWQATQPVSGTFYQATQPVSIASMPSTPVTGTFWQATQPVSGPLTDTQLRASAVPVSGTFFQATQPVSIAGTVATSAASLPLPTGAAADTSLTGHAQTFKAVTTATTLSTANTTVTLTIAAAGASLFHYITRIRITMHNTSAAAVAGSAVTLAFTSTNIPGSLAWSEGNALAAGVSKTVCDEVLSQPIKTTTANTATTIVAPACGAGVLVRITVYYYTAA